MDTCPKIRVHLIPHVCSRDQEDGLGRKGEGLGGAGMCPGGLSPS